jgi:8-oxo-dGTP diphosphatase
MMTHDPLLVHKLTTDYGNFMIPSPVKPVVVSYDYPRPAYTADTVVFCLDEVLLIERGKDPFKGKLALPGGFVNQGETSYQAAARELEEETGLRLIVSPSFLVGLFDNPGRDPRGWVISAAYRARIKNKLAVKGMDDAVGAGWYKLSAIKRSDLAFDHYKIINNAFDLEGKSL